jgi:hypothetical protein
MNILNRVNLCAGVAELEFVVPEDEFFSRCRPTGSWRMLLSHRQGSENGTEAQQSLSKEYRSMKHALPTSTPRQTPTQVTKSTSDVQEQIRLRAYELYEQREKDGGHELYDWLQAEAEVTQQKTQTVAA